MIKYNSCEPLFSIHIPKCAGSSFREVLRKWFKENFFQHYYDEKLNRMPEKVKILGRHGNDGSGYCIHGHFMDERGDGVFQYYPSAKQFISILRDPFDLAISTYFYVKKLGNDAYLNGKPHPIIAQKQDLKSYMSMAKKSYILRFFPFEMSMDNYKEIIDKNFIHLGTSENMQKNINALANKLGFQPIDIGMDNASEKDEEIPEVLREEYANENRLEYAIYHYAKEIEGNYIS